MRFVDTRAAVGAHHIVERRPRLDAALRLIGGRQLLPVMHRANVQQSTLHFVSV